MYNAAAGELYSQFRLGPPGRFAMLNRRLFLTTGIGSLVAAHALPADRMRFAMPRVRDNTATS
jgi:hypothetical protein